MNSSSWIAIPLQQSMNAAALPGSARSLRPVLADLPFPGELVLEPQVANGTRGAGPRYPRRQ